MSERHRVPLNVRERAQRMRLCEEQGWLCWFCKQPMETDSFAGGKTPPNSAVMFRIDTRYTFERGLHSGERRRVAAHYACADKQAKSIESAVPLDELHDRAGRPGLAASGNVPEHPTGLTESGSRDSLVKLKDPGGL